MKQVFVLGCVGYFLSHSAVAQAQFDLDFQNGEPGCIEVTIYRDNTVSAEFVESYISNMLGDRDRGRQVVGDLPSDASAPTSAGRDRAVKHESSTADLARDKRIAALPADQLAHFSGAPALE